MDIDGYEFWLAPPSLAVWRSWDPKMAHDVSKCKYKMAENVGIVFLHIATRTNYSNALLRRLYS